MSGIWWARLPAQAVLPQPPGGFMRRALVTPSWTALLVSFALAGSAFVMLAPPALAYVGPISSSWYLTAADLAGSGDSIYRLGYNAPTGPQVVFLQAGQVCVTSTGGS